VTPDSDPADRPAGEETAADVPPDAADAADAADAPGPPTGPRRKPKRPLWQELPLLIALSLGLAVLIKTFVMQAFYIPSGSMQQTLELGDRVLVNKLSYRFRDIRRGEIVVFRGPPSWKHEHEVPEAPGNALQRVLRPVGRALGAAPPGEKDFIKRVIGLPGDTVACCDDDGRVTVNGVPLDESSYLFEDNQQEIRPVTLGPGQMWVMGDHRLVSLDSRAAGQGSVPTRNVIGRAFVIVWPAGHVGRLTRPDTSVQARALGAVSSPAGLGFATALPVVAVRRRRRTRAAA
jgi:signal peptidase I